MPITTAEFVTPKHPDKICDLLADALLDAYREHDPRSRCAIEIMGGHKLVTINGEVTSAGTPDIKSIIHEIVGDDFRVITNIALQSPEIARGVDSGGAGDQGIMKGYATRRTASMMPKEYDLARSLCQKVFAQFPFDGKTQVTLEGDRVAAVVASFQNAPNNELEPLVRSIIAAEKYFINPAGEWAQGGFNADTGLSGRKLIVDNYGPEVAIGGGSFSGKDATKVDRSGAYMARKIAVDFVKGGAHEAFVKLAYAIGVAEPVMAIAVVDGKEFAVAGYDLRPAGIREALGLDAIRFADTCTWGHFGRGFSWDA